MINYIRTFYIESKIKKTVDLELNKYNYFNLIKKFKNENFISAKELLRLDILLDSYTYSVKLRPLDGNLTNSRTELEKYLKLLIKKDVERKYINLRDVGFLSCSRDEGLFSDYTNISSWWLATLFKGKKSLSDEKREKYLKFNQEQISETIIDKENPSPDSFTDNHQDFYKFQWHNKIMANNGGGSHRLGRVITLCNEFDHNEFYETNLHSFYIDNLILDTLFEKYCLFIVFKDESIIHFINFIYSKKIEAYTLDLENFKILIIKKDNTSSSICSILNNQQNIKEFLEEFMI
ncbi:MULTISPECIES: DUF6685 family protein [Acinetobacter]|nr:MULTISPECIES: DUF6685 family protein [Acinetobacter]MCV2445143.1 hypothetical protein [Acinetobacter bereziniae]